MKYPFLITQSILILVLFFIGTYLFQYTLYKVSQLLFQISLVYFASTHIFSGLYFISIKSKNENRKAYLTMIMRSAKFVLTLFFALTMILIEKENDTQIGVTIVVLYALYTIVEVYFFKVIQNKS